VLQAVGIELVALPAKKPLNRPTIAAFIKKLPSVSNLPDEVEAASGLKATSALGSFAVAKVGAEASYTVTLKWKWAAERKAQPRRGTSRQSGG
jgi:hypothetical protein